MLEEEKMGFKKEITKRLETIRKLSDLDEKIGFLCNSIIEGLRNGNKILTAGNGGSASESLHFSSELMWSFKRKNKGIPVISLCADNSLITAVSNDWDFKKIFSLQIEILGRNGDIFIAFTTSGMSENIIEALKTSKKKNIKTFLLSGRDGGRAKNYADFSLLVPSSETPVIQECHLFIIHEICRRIENELWGEENP